MTYSHTQLVNKTDSLVALQENPFEVDAVGCGLYRRRSENGNEALCPPNSGSQRPAMEVLQEGQHPSGVSL